MCNYGWCSYCPVSVDCKRQAKNIAKSGLFVDDDICKPSIIDKKIKELKTQMEIDAEMERTLVK